MAIFNEILVGRFNRAFQKLFAIKATAPLRQLAGELMPVINVFRGVEDRYLEGWDRFGIMAVISALAAQTSGVRLRNPVGSNIIAVVEKIYFTTSLADNTFIEQGAATVDLTTLVAVNIIRFDARQRPSPTLILSQQNNPSGLLQNIKLQTGQAGNISVDPILFEDQEIPLLPGDALQVRTNTQNIQMNCSLWWRERILEESERS